MQAEPIHPAPSGNAGPDWRAPATWVALAFAAFQLWMAAFHPLSSQVIRALHVGFVLWLIFLLYPPFQRRGPWLAQAGRALGWALGVAGFGTGLYQWVFEADLTQRAGELEGWDWWVGIAAIALVFEAARRVMGWGLPIICAVFLAYSAFGQHLPGALAHRGYDWEILIATLGFGTEGIYGTPTYVSSTYIFLFILFGAFLEQAGMVRLFTDFAMGTVGHTRGGPAKVAVLSSGLMGTINGSGVANVVTTGQFTIPLMKRFGYSPAFAGGVEATSSMGGQIMPPVMGAVAFIMAETINVPYLAIVQAALIPAILYFVTVFWMVHLEAGRKGLVGLPREQCPNPWTAVRERWYLLLPLLGLVVLLFSGYTPMFSGTVGLALTVVLIFGAAVMQGLRGRTLRVVFWVLLALACSGFFRFGAGTFFVVTAALVALTYALRCGQQARALALQALVDGALRLMRPWLIGECAIEPERVSEKLHQMAFWQGRGGAVTHAISGIDIAMWDVLGKATGQPVARLLGGCYRDRIKPYGSILFDEPARLRDKLQEVTARGFRAIKMGWRPFGRVDRRLDEALVRTARETVGPDVELMVDAGGSEEFWPHGYKWAVETARMLANYDVTWFEEALAPDDIEGYIKLREHSPVPIAAGEVLTRRQSFMPWIERGAVDYIQPDCTKCGGLSEARRIGWMAYDHGLMLAPHGWNTAVGLAADLHLVAALPVARWVEYLTPSPYIEEIVTTPFTLDAEGMLPIPTAPGLGIELDWESVKRFSASVP